MAKMKPLGNNAKIPSVFGESWMKLCEELVVMASSLAGEGGEAEADQAYVRIKKSLRERTNQIRGNRGDAYVMRIGDAKLLTICVCEAIIGELSH